MTVVSGSIPHLATGVSQQPAPNRIRTAAEAIENAYLSVISGAQRRQPSTHIATLSTALSLSTGSAIWTVRRDAASKYILAFVDGDMELYDATDGSKHTITFNASKSYLDTTAPKEDIRVATVGDTIFILNRNETVAGAAVTDARTDPSTRASVFIKRAVASSTYAIYVDNVLAGSFGTSDNTTAGTALEGTSKIAEELVTDLISNGYTDAEQFGPVVTFGITAGETLQTLDQFGGQAMRAYTNRVQSFDELPPEEEEGRIVKVLPDFDEGGDGFYVKFTEGVWEETVGYDETYALTATTMPHKLVKTGAATWDFDVQTLETRKVGDSDTNAPPSFVGKSLNDISIHKGRMLLLADTNVIMSEVSVLENFFRTTTTQLLDGDRIDVSANTTEVHTLRNVMDFEKRLFAMSDTGIFEVGSSESLLSANTAEMSLVSIYENNPQAKPATAGKVVFFSQSGVASSRVYEMRVDGAIDVTQFDDVTEHVPDYVPTGITQMSASSSEDMLVALSENDTAALYVYRWKTVGGQKRQSAWNRWTFTGAEILGASFIESDLFVMAKFGSTTHLMKVEVTDRPFSDANREIMLDNRTDHMDATAVYDAATDITTVTTPWSYSGTLEFWTDSDPYGENLLAEKVADDEYEIAGDVTSRSWAFGIPYTWEIELSEQYVREERGGGEVSIQDGRLQLARMNFQYQGTSYFEVEITPRNRSARTVSFNGRILGDAQNTFGDNPLRTGSLPTVVMAQNTGVTIKIQSDKPLPASIGSVEWLGHYYPNARRRL